MSGYHVGDKRSTVYEDFYGEGGGEDEKRTVVTAGSEVDEATGEGGDTL
jgi:hypothetical protein